MNTRTRETNNQKKTEQDITRKNRTTKTKNTKKTTTKTQKTKSEQNPKPNDQRRKYKASERRFRGENKQNKTTAPLKNYDKSKLTYACINTELNSEGHLVASRESKQIKQSDVNGYK